MKRRWNTRTTVLILLFAASALCVLGIVILKAKHRTPDDFVSPSEAERLEAIGSLEGLSESEQRVFLPGASFLPMPEPGPSDWLANHVEMGQTFNGFVRSKPNRPFGEQSKIYFLPLGEFDPEISPDLDDLMEVAEAYFQMEVRLHPAVPLDSAKIENRINSQSGQIQFLSTDILDLLKRQLPPDAYCLLGITMQDLYPEDSWNFVFGQASLRDRVGVYSFARYHPGFYGEAKTDSDKELMLKRSLGVLVHETGHMFGIEHCIYFQCVMNGSNHLEESDSRDLYLCPVCLRKLAWSSGFDAVERYEQLQTLYRKLGLNKDADWIKKRRAWIRNEE
jgi:archaemetzincin